MIDVLMTLALWHVFPKFSVKVNQHEIFKDIGVFLSFRITVANDSSNIHSMIACINDTFALSNLKFNQIDA